jgi:hypothetical protein
MNLLQTILKGFLLFLFALLALVGCMFLLASCSTAKELLDKAEKKDPAIVAEYARDKYPCTELLKTDTAIIYKDSTIWIECPDSIPAQYETVRYDTVNNVITKLVKVPVTIRTPERIVTRWFEDSAKLKINAIEINKLQADNSKMADHIVDLNKKVSHRGKENWIWRIIASFFIFLFVWRKYKQLTTIKLA